MTIRTGVHSALASDEYHGDHGSLSASGAKRLLPPSVPAKFKYLRDNPPAPKPHFDFGHAAHKFVLREGDEIAPVYAEDWRTKDAREQRIKAHAEGKIPLLIDEVEKAMQMAQEVHAHPEAARLLKEGHAEISLLADDPTTGVRLRGRPDWMTHPDDRLWLVDYKTAVSANPDAFGRKAYDFGYHIQFAWYVTLARLLELDKSPAFVFIVQEKEPPYLVSVCELDADAFNLGRQDMIRATAIFQQCTETGVWPGYSPDIIPVSLPAWAHSNQPTINDLFQGADA